MKSDQQFCSVINKFLKSSCFGAEINWYIGTIDDDILKIQNIYTIRI